ncbi:MAG: amidohydrolase family protein [Pseudomonadota bacterium]|nr:amidohydrolase family protein [Pseudomonadota bacterium]
MTLFSEHAVIDVDTHITEPPDLWTSRVAGKWHDLVPHIERVKDRDFWFINGKRGLAPGAVSMAGYNGRPPNEFPATYQDISASAYDAKARLVHMDEQGIYAQVIYPNVGGFGSQNFLTMKDKELKLACVKAYNDFLIEWTSASPERLLAVCALPFWDIAESVAEISRCAALGHRSVLFPSQPQDFKQPDLSDTYWDPVWECAQSFDLPISFHIGGQAALGVKEGEFSPRGGPMGRKAKFARYSALAFIGNGLGISELICGGVCHRFPTLKFVSVESGAGWIPTLLEALDWQWHNAGVVFEHPEYDLLPSEYFRRQIYACFWFERDMLARAAQLYPDNLMYETDFPHPTSMSPGPATIAVAPREYARQAFADMPGDLIGKLLHDTAARVYHVQ